MNDTFYDSWHTSVEQAKTALRQGIFTPEVAQQAILILGSVLLAFGLAWSITRISLPRLQRHWGVNSLSFSLADKFSSYILPLFTALALEVTVLTFCEKFPNCHLIEISAKLAWTWLLVRLFTSFVMKGTLSWTLVLIIYFILVLEIIGVLKPLNHFLDGFGIQLDNYRLSLLSILKGAILATFLLSFINYLCKFLETNLPKSSTLSPRHQLLLLKIIRLTLYILAVVVALDSVGLDFYLVSVFSGAFGLGLGFGLQRVVSNLFSGFVILMDKSIRPGDVIETDGLYGWIESLHGRFVAMITRDGKSHLIPNEHLVANKVINWSFSNPNVRLKIPLGISYGSDIHLAMKLMLAAAARHPRVLKDPQAMTRLMGFGDSAINLELRIWIKDPQNGITDVCSDIQIDIWDAFLNHGISFPFPQRDVYLKTPTELTVVLQNKGRSEEDKPSFSGSGESEELLSQTRTTGDPPPK
jgi:small-conductance mechanosensitive channel